MQLDPLHSPPPPQAASSSSVPTAIPFTTRTFHHCLKSCAVRLGIPVILLIYALGLFQDISKPWSGLHDWNGAFFSQLARNQARYPWEIHHGMPVVAVGADAPPETERSIYATHPPALVWLVRTAFRLLGESESAARLLPITCSLMTLYLLLHLWKVAHDETHALIAGVFYSLMPMAVYFGRMVDHEAIGLFLMAAAGVAWVRLTQDASNCRDPGRGRSPTPRFRTGLRSAALITALAAGIWVDWAGCLFAGLFGLYLLKVALSPRDDRRRAAFIVGLLLLITLLGMLAFLVHAGLNGSWTGLLAIFNSRATGAGGDASVRTLTTPGSAWQNSLSNFSLPLLALAGLGILLSPTTLPRLTKTAPAGISAPAGGARLTQHAARTALTIIALTGVIWLALFTRQYQVHQYWAFYCGPAAASFAAFAVQRLAMLTARRGDLKWLPAICVIATLGFELSGMRRYFSLRARRLEADIAAWRIIADETRPRDRIALLRDPTWTELRGDYEFRNIVPPQFAWYADRAFDVAAPNNAFPDIAGRCALFAIRIEDAARMKDELAPFQARFPHRFVAESWVIFDLRRPIPPQ